MLKKILACILVFVFCSNPLCLAAKELGMKEIAPVSSMSQTEKMNLLKKYISLFDLSGQPQSEEYLNEILDVMNVYFSEYDYHDKASYDLGKEIMHSYVYNYPFDYEVMKNKLKDKTTQIELIQCYAKIPPEDVKVWEEALNLGFLKYNKKYKNNLCGLTKLDYKSFVETNKLLEQNSFFTKKMKDTILKYPSSNYTVLVVKTSLDDIQIAPIDKFDKINKTLEYHTTSTFPYYVDHSHTEKQLRENYNHMSEICRESYNLNNKNQNEYYILEAMKTFFIKFPDANNWSSNEFLKINKLGSKLFKHVNEKNYDFVISKLKNNDTDWENLEETVRCIKFDINPSDKFSQNFDKGYIHSILASLQSYQIPVKLSELEDYIALADSMEQKQNLNTEQINEILSFDLNIEYKTKIVEKTVEKKSLTPEKKYEIINEQMQKKAEVIKKNDSFTDEVLKIVGAPFILALALIPPPFVYLFGVDNLRQEIEENGFKKLSTIIYTGVYALATISPINLISLISTLKEEKSKD